MDSVDRCVRTSVACCVPTSELTTQEGSGRRQEAIIEGRGQVGVKLKGQLFLLRSLVKVEVNSDEC